MIRLNLLPLAMLPILSGCLSGGNVMNDFDCRAAKGTCAPMTSIDASAVASIGSVRPSSTGFSDPVAGPRLLGGPVLAGAALGDTSAPPRTSDRVLRVVFPAHIDADGVYREESAAHAVVESAAWAEALGARPVSAALPARGAPALRTSGIAVEPAPVSALATLDEIVANRAARKGGSKSGLAIPAAPMPTAMTAPAPPVLSPSPVAFSQFPSRAPAPQSLAEVAAGLSAPVLPPLDPRSPVANYDTADVVAVHAVLPSAPSLASRASPANGHSPSPTIRSSAPAALATADAPYGSRPVRWKGRTYQVPFKNPQVAAASAAAADAAQPNPTAELNKAALARAGGARPGPLPASTLVAITPTADAQVALARVRAMAAPVIARGVEQGRQDATAAAPQGFALPFSSATPSLPSASAAPSTAPSTPGEPQ